MLFLIAGIWFMAGFVWFEFAPNVFISIGHRVGTNTAAGLYLLLTLAITFGWIAPLLLGGYRVVKKRMP